MLQQLSNPCVLSEPWAIWGCYCRGPPFIVLSELTRTPLGVMHVLFCFLEGTGSRTCMCACPTCLPGEDLGRGQRHFKCSQISFPPELIWSPYMHPLCVFPLALWPGGWGRRKTLGWECLCAEFIVGACLAIGVLSSLGSVLLRAGETALCMEGATHYPNVSPRRGTAPKSSVAKDSSWDNVAGSLWMDSPLLISTM